MGVPRKRSTDADRKSVSEGIIRRAARAGRRCAPACRWVRRQAERIHPGRAPADTRPRNRRASTRKIGAANASPRLANRRHRAPYTGASGLCARARNATMTTASSDLAVLFADVSGSTRLYETLGDERALATVGQCLALVREACDGHSGRVIKTIGDEVMAVFPLADQAAQAAAAMQARVSTEPFAVGQRIAIRVGFHFGPALETDSDVFGDSVNVAARLAGVAHASQVITSAATAAMLSPWLRARTRELTALTVKGKLRDMSVYELLWQESNDDLTTLSTRVNVSPTRLSIRHGGREIVL